MSKGYLGGFSALLVAVTSAGLLFLAGGGVASAAAHHPAGPTREVTVLASAPCFVSGYTLHAQEQMAERKVSSDYVEQVVHSTCRRAKWQKGNKTWKYTSRGLTVIANNNGYVVTVWRN